MLKNMMKRVGAAVAAAVMLTGFGAATANAQDASELKGTLKVTSESAEFNRKTVDVYRMFDVESVSGSNIAYELNSDWKNFFTTAAQSGGAGLSGVSSSSTLTEVSEAAYNHISGLNDKNNNALADFAAKARDWAINGSHPISRTASTTASESDDKYVATFENLAYGYYLIDPQGGSTDSTRHTNAQLLSVHQSGETTVTLKSQYPTVDKSIIDAPTTDGDGSVNVDVDDDWDGKHDMELESVRAPKDGKTANDAQIGDTVWFQLKSEVPDMSEYDSYTFKFHDTLSKGLTFNENNLSVTVGDKTLTKGTGGTTYTLTGPTNEDDGTHKITIELNNMKSSGYTVGAEIVVTYSATLNENAATGTTDPNTNTADVEYSNDPSNSDSTGTSTDDKTKTYTFGFTIDKFACPTTGDCSYDASNSTRLAGAEFEISKDNGGKPGGDAMGFITTDGSDSTALTARPALATEFSSQTTTLRTPASGKITVNGLAAGTYWITETKAPEGYNKLAKPIKVVITPTYDNTTGELQSVAVQYGDRPTDASDGVIPVGNKTGAELPSTGGMGTVLFTVAGVTVILLGVAWTMKRSRNERR